MKKFETTVEFGRIGNVGEGEGDVNIICGISSKLLKCAKCCLKTNPFEKMYCNLILRENDDDYEKYREENEELKVKKEEDVCG